MPKKLVRVHVLVDFGTLKNMGHACDSVVDIDADLAASLVELGYVEIIEPPKPPKKAAPDVPEQRPAPTDEVEKR